VKVNLREVLGLRDLQREIDDLDERLGDLWSDMEIEERVGPRKALSEEFGRLEERRKALTLKWLK
jgi:hypothetical protein